MSSNRRRLALLLGSCLAVSAHAAPPEDARLRHLLELTNVEQDYAGTIAQFEALQRDTMARLLQDAPPERRDALLQVGEQNQAEMRRIMAWDRLEPVYLDVYRKTYDAQDIEAMIAFYESAAGQRMVKRQPELMRNLMQAVGMLLEPEMAAMRERIQRQVEALPATVAPGEAGAPPTTASSRTTPSP